MILKFTLEESKMGRGRRSRNKFFLLRLFISLVLSVGLVLLYITVSTRSLLIVSFFRELLFLAKYHLKWFYSSHVFLFLIRLYEQSHPFFLFSLASLTRALYVTLEPSVNFQSISSMYSARSLFSLLNLSRCPSLLWVTFC